MINPSVKLSFLVINSDLLLNKNTYSYTCYLDASIKLTDMLIIRIYYYPISAEYSISFIPILTLPRSGLWVMYMYIYGAHLFKLKEFIALHVVYGNHAMLCSVKIPSQHVSYCEASLPTPSLSVSE